MFDPYRKWLGIPEGQRPPTHYQLLGISPDEQDRDVINAAVVRQSAFVRTFQVGRYSEDATRLLNEIAAAKICLLDPTKRAEYDARIQPVRQDKSPSCSPRPPRPPATLSPPPAIRPPPPAAVVRQPARMALTSPPSIAPPSRQMHAPPTLHSLSASQASAVLEGVFADDDAHRSYPALTSKPAESKTPIWLWALPAGATVLFAVVLLAVLFSRRPPETTMVQSGPALGAAGPVIEGRVAQHPGPVTSMPAPANSPSSTPPARFPKPQLREVPPPSVVQSPVEVVTSREEKEEDDAFAPSQPSGSPSSGRNEAADKLSSARSASARSSSAGADWSDGSTLSVPARRNAKITLAHGNGPFAAADGTFYRLTDGEVIGKMDTTEYDSFAAMSDADTPAWLGPQQPVSLKVQVSASGDGSPEQVAADLTKLFESRLTADGLRVADGQPAVFTIDYTEQYVPPRSISPPAGFPLRIPARQIPAQTQSTLTIRLQAGVGSNDLWKTTIRASANDDATGGQRAAINAELARQLRTITMPFFLPASSAEFVGDFRLREGAECVI